MHTNLTFVFFFLIFCIFLMGLYLEVRRAPTLLVNTYLSQVEDNIVLAMPGGWMKMLVEIMLLLHLITAFPIITNPPAQFFEEMLNVPTSKKFFFLATCKV